MIIELRPDYITLYCSKNKTTFFNFLFLTTPPEWLLSKFSRKAKIYPSQTQTATASEVEPSGTIPTILNPVKTLEQFTVLSALHSSKDAADSLRAIKESSWLNVNSINILMPVTKIKIQTCKLIKCFLTNGSAQDLKKAKQSDIIRKHIIPT